LLISLRVDPDSGELSLGADPDGAESIKASIPWPCVNKVSEGVDTDDLQDPRHHIIIQKKRGVKSHACVPLRVDKVTGVRFFLARGIFF